MEDDYQTWATWDASEYWVALNNYPAMLQPRRGYTYPPTLMHTAGCVRLTFTAGGPIEQHWALNIEDIAVFMYENVGVPVPTSLVTIPKIHTF